MIDGRFLAEGREAEVFLQPDGTVLKLLRDPGAGDRVAREAAALTALAAGDYPAPTLVRTTTVDGRPGLVTTFVDGSDMLSALERRPWSVVPAADTMGTLHAAMHRRAAPADLPDLHDLLRGRIEGAAPLDDGHRRQVVALLGSLPRGDRLCHYDLHLGNILGTAADPVVIDWGDATRGPAAADVARTTVLHRFARLPPGAPA
ncbi:MAG TPA: aminoglycoside phosphotransferase family protein, partial [Acidimicrobiales bacterium]|nr:aminoglycoside phosphotransferase family protein [Acidimicrobiales bacterium]